MVEYIIKLPDVGEGIAEAELVEWCVKVGDLVREDTVLGSVMTDKATVEIPSPVEGIVVWLSGNVGDVIAIGSDLVRLSVASDIQSFDTKKAIEAPIASGLEPLAGRARTEHQPRSTDDLLLFPAGQPTAPAQHQFRGQVSHPAAGRPMAAPAVRLRARESGVDLRQIPPSGPAGRITHEDLDAFLAGSPPTTRFITNPRKTFVEDIKLIGLRRKIAEKMSLANSRIPHITYVEEVDVTALETVREVLNNGKRTDRPRLTLLPFLMRAVVRTVAEQPEVNARFDDNGGIVHRYSGVHIGVAVQTSGGLSVPVVRHAEALDLWGCAAEVSRLAEASKTGRATRDELSGSTITITSLGAMGGLVTTPIINYPEVAIVGVNKIVVRPYWDGSAFVPRKMMNLSSSFDHRVIDGWDAALFVQRIKTLLEAPATIFIDG